MASNNYGDCDDSLNAQKKEGTKEEREVCCSVESLAWITEIDLAQKKRQSISGRTKDGTERLPQCFVGSLSEQSEAKREVGRGRGAHAIKVRSRYADDCCFFHSVPRCAALSRTAPCVRPLFPLYDWTETKGTNQRMNEPTNG